MSTRTGNRSCSWLSINVQCAVGLTLYVTASFTAGLLSGSPVFGAAVSGSVVFAAVVAWRRWAFGAWMLQPFSGQARKIQFWVFAFIGLVMCFFGGQSLAVWFYTAYGSPAFDSAQATQSAVPATLLLFSLVVAAPAGEEALMRGLVYSLLRRRWSVLASALVSSMIFAALHGNLVQIVVALPLGMLLAFVYEHVGRLWLVTVLHAMFNLASVLVPVYLVEVMATPVVFSIALAGAVSALVALR